MTIGDWLYRLTPRDQQVTPLQLARITQSSVGNLNVSRVITVEPPRGFALLVEAIWWRARPATGTSVTVVELTLRSPQQQLRTVLDSNTAALGVDVPKERTLTFPHSLIIDSRDELIMLAATFTTASTAHILEIGVTGTLIPVGNLSMGILTAVPVL